VTEIKPQPPATGGQPQAAVTEPPSHGELKRAQRPWQATEGVCGLPADQIDDLRRHENELIRNEASEFSIGKGTEPPWVARQARREHRYATPEEGGRYHGKTPPCGPPHTPMRHDHRGGVQLGKALRRYG
jgi:hypothetical protein